MQSAQASPPDDPTTNAENPAVTVAIIEDDPVTLVGLSEVIRHVSWFALTSAARSVEEFDAAELPQPNVVILDLRLRGGGLEGANAVRHLVASGHTVLVVSMFDEEVPVVEAIRAGAAGYLTKEAEPEEVVRAIGVVASGGTYISATVAGYLLKERISLTNREREILRFVANGETTPDIAKMLYISEATVNSHLDRIRNKTGHRRRTDLTRYALEQGLIPRERPKGP